MVFTGKDLSEGVKTIEEGFLTTKIKLTIDNKTETTQRGLKRKRSPSDILFIDSGYASVKICDNAMMPPLKNSR